MYSTICIPLCSMPSIHLLLCFRLQSGDTPADVAPADEMRQLLTKCTQRRKDSKQTHNDNTTLRCMELQRRGGEYHNEALGLSFEVSKLALDDNLFFICRRIPAVDCHVDLGKSWRNKFVVTCEPFWNT